MDLEYIKDLENQIKRALNLKRIDKHTGIHDNWIKILTDRVKKYVPDFRRITMTGKIVCENDGEEYLLIESDSE